MTQVRFGGDPWGYKAAQWTYNMPAKAEQFLKPKVGAAVSGFIKKQLNSDFSEFTNVSMGKVKTLLAEPPKLPLLLWLYPGTVGPRLFRAYQRGKETNDYREMGDVLRRDLTAITLFVFALTPLVNFTSQRVQNKTGVNLIRKEGDVLSYSDFRNYEIDSAKAIKQIVVENNGEGLEKAVTALANRNLKHDNALKQHFTAMKANVQKLVESFRKNQNKWDDKLHNELLERAYAPFAQVSKSQDGLIAQAKKAGSPELLKSAEGLKNEVKDVLKNYAKVRRLPSDVLSFAVMIGLIGWFPMWFNGVWNKKQFEKKKAAASQGAQPQQPAPALAFSGALPGRPGQAAALPFARVQSPQTPQFQANPFNRTV